jgi:beta-glucosidase
MHPHARSVGLESTADIDREKGWRQTMIKTGGPMLGEFSRRHFAKLAGFSAFGMARKPAKSAGGEVMAAQDQHAAANLPSGFVWGTATSAYQIEGAVNEDGRGRSIWDTFAHRPGNIADGSNADRAADHYRRYKEDVRLMKDIGVSAYRFSIAWPRVFPDGNGKPNLKGLDFYNRLVDELITNGIEPYATLYHWDLPQSLQDRFGGWQSAETSKAFADYAGYVAAHLGDRVKYIFTLNECARFVELGYGSGTDAPGLRLPPAKLNQVRHNAALGHGLAVQAIRGKGPAGVKVGPAENIAACLPAIDTPENIRAAEIATEELNAGFLNVILKGKYTERFLAHAGKDAPKYEANEMEVISSPIDFVGLNIYAPQHYVVATEPAPGYEVLPFPESFPHMSAEWIKIGPETAYWVPRLAAKVWGLDMIYISENGTSAIDRLTADGKVYDLDRITYLRNYLAQLQRVTAEGAPVRGYFLWSLMDNFEWGSGFEERFGLYHVDFNTQVRTPKLSASFYRNVIARNAVGG